MQERAELAQVKAQNERQDLLGKPPPPPPPPPPQSSKASSSRNAPQTAAQREAAGAAGAAHEAMDALRERGEKIGVLNERVADLGKEAEDFFTQAKKIRQQAERSSRWF